MDKLLKTYLYYNCEFAEADTWDYKFAYYLGTVINQVTTIKQKIFCNFDIPGTQFIQPDNVEINAIDAIIFVQNTSKNLTEAFDAIKQYINMGDELVKNKTFVVLRRPVINKASKGVLVSFRCYHFFELNQRTLQNIEYDPDIRGESEKGYWDALTNLAYDIKLLSQVSGNAKPARNNTVFLAEVTNDQLKNRERIKRELLLSGFHVLPTHPLPQSFTEFEGKVKQLLSECIISVNILGEIYGESPDGTDYSYPELQNRCFIKVISEQKNTTEPKLLRIIWMPPNLDIYDEKQIQYINRIRKEISASQNTELVQSTIYDLNEIIDKKIRKSLANVFELINEEQKNEVLIVILKRDETTLIETVSVFNKNKIPYQVLNIESSGLDSITSLMKLLKHKKHVLIINNEKDNLQLTSILSFILRSKGYADALPVASIGLLLTSKINKYEEYLPVNLHTIYFDKNNLQEKVELYLSNIRL